MANPSCSKAPDERDLQDPSLETLISCHGGSDSEEYVSYVMFLLEKETKMKKKKREKSCSCSSMAIGRRGAVDFILNSREILGFQWQTAYLSVTYLDRFLSLRKLEGWKPWAIELVSIGCVSIAMKMQENEAWGFSSLQIGEFEFEIGAILRMEVLILSTLDWRMGSVTPFVFLPYFMGVFFSEATPNRRTMERVLELIMKVVKDVSLVDHHPSAIAFAAIFLSFDQCLTRKALELKIKSIPCGRFLDLEDIFTCYNIMHQCEGHKCNTPPKLIALSPISISRMVSLRNSHATSSISSKRKRLEFDQNQGSRTKQRGRHDES